MCAASQALGGGHEVAHWAGVHREAVGPAAAARNAWKSFMTELAQIDAVGDYAIIDDGIQWIVQRYQGGRWRNVSFVRSTKDALARCLREAEASASEANALLARLPNHHRTWPEAGSRRLNPKTLCGGLLRSQNASCHAGSGITRRASHRWARRAVQCTVTLGRLLAARSRYCRARA